jgi:hypothetical protein
LDTESFEQERRLAADKGTGRLTLAVEWESGASELVDSVVTENERFLFLEGKDGCFPFFC